MSVIARERSPRPSRVLFGAAGLLRLMKGQISGGTNVRRADASCYPGQRLSLVLLSRGQRGREGRRNNSGGFFLPNRSGEVTGREFLEGDIWTRQVILEVSLLPGEKLRAIFTMFTLRHRAKFRARAVARSHERMVLRSREGRP